MVCKVGPIDLQVNPELQTDLGSTQMHSSSPFKLLTCHLSNESAKHTYESTCLPASGPIKHFTMKPQ